MFNVGGVSIGSIWSIAEFFAVAPIWGLYLLWFSTLLLFGSGSYIVAKRAWEKAVQERKKVEQERSDLEERLRPKLRFYFTPYCCLRRRASSIFIGVHNPSALTIGNILVRIDVPRVGTRGYVLPWSDYGFGVSIAIDPCTPTFHRHFEVADITQIQGERKLRMAHRDFDRLYLDVGEYEIILYATGTNVTPVMVRAMLGLSQDGAITLKPLPDFGTEGWAQKEA